MDKTQDKRRVATNPSTTSAKAQREEGPFVLTTATAESLPLPPLLSATSPSSSSSSSSFQRPELPSSPCHSMTMANEGVSLPLGMFSVQGPLSEMPVLALPGQRMSAQGPGLSAQGSGLSSPVYLNAGEIRARIEERRVQGTMTGKKHVREELEPEYNCAARFSSTSCMASMGQGFMTLDTQLEKRRRQLLASSSSTVTSPSPSL